MENTQTYGAGAWIVHSQYGIGQIKSIDVKSISGEKTRYYRIQTSDSTFWVPVNQIDSDVIRPLASAEEIQQAIATLQKPPKEMSSNHKTRHSRIRRAKIRNTPRAFARILRDLRARRREKGILNQTERSAFRTFRKRLVEEWAIVRSINKEKAASRLDKLLGLKQQAPHGEVSAVIGSQMSASSSTASPHRQSKWMHWPRRQTNKISR